MMFCVIVSKIFTPWSAINVQLFLVESIHQPMLSHIHLFFSEDICAEWCGGLDVAQFSEGDPEGCATLDVLKSRFYF
jgi:hypothetical protein